MSRRTVRPPVATGAYVERRDPRDGWVEQFAVRAVGPLRAWRGGRRRPWARLVRTVAEQGVVVDAQPFPEARRPALKLTIDFGPLGVKRSSAQITTHYGRETLVGRPVIAVVNFPPKRIGPFLSEVLVLGAYDEQGEVVLLRPDLEVSPGAKIG